MEKGAAGETFLDVLHAKNKVLLIDSSKHPVLVEQALLSRL